MMKALLVTFMNSKAFVSELTTVVQRLSKKIPALEVEMIFKTQITC